MPADIIPSTAWIDTEEVTAAKLYLRIGVPVNTLNNQVQTIAALVGDSGTTGATLSNSWVSYDSGVVEEMPQYELLNGWVEVRGCIKNGTASATIFTLPLGMRPLKNRIFLCPSGSAFNGIARVDVGPTGVVQIPSYGASGSNLGVSLDAIRFIAQQ